MAPKERAGVFRRCGEAQERGVAAQDAVLQGSKCAESTPLSRKHRVVVLQPSSSHKSKGNYPAKSRRGIQWHNLCTQTRFCQDIGRDGSSGMGTYRCDPKCRSQQSNHVTLSQNFFLLIGDQDVKLVLRA